MNKAEINNHIKKIAQLFELGKHEQALPLINKIIVADPKNYLGRLCLAIYYYQAKKFRQSKDMLEALLVDYPEEPRVYKQLSLMASRKKKMIYLNKILELDPNSVYALSAKSLLVGKKNKKLSWELISQAVKIDPVDFETRSSLLIYYARWDKKKFNKEIEVLKKNQDLDPALLFNAAVGLIEQRVNKEARPIVLFLINYFPNYDPKQVFDVYKSTFIWYRVLLLVFLSNVLIFAYVRGRT